MIKRLIVPLIVLLFVPIFGSAQTPHVVLPRLSSLLPARDPLPIRRVFLSPKQYADLIVTPGQSPFVRMTRDEFETRLRAASLVLNTPRPFISDSKYTATYVDGALTGTAEWVVNNPSGKSGVLSLDPLRIALSDVQWQNGPKASLSRTVTTGSDEKSKTVVAVDADLVSPQGGNPARKLTGKWSSRSANTQEPNRFLLRFPPANVAHLDLVLPANFSPVIRRDRAILLGPFPTEDPKQRRWSISLGGQDTCEFTIKNGTEPAIAQPGPTKAVQRWTIAESGFEGKVSFEFDSAHQSADEYRFDLSTGLQVVEVVADVPVGWKVEGQLLRVTPVDPGTLPRIAITVRTVAAPFGTAWTIPTVALERRLPSDDSIQLKLASGIRISAFEHGDYQIVESDTTDDGGRVVKLSGTFSNGQSAQRSNPTLTFDVVPAQITVTERATMEVHRKDLRVRFQATITAVRGPVCDLSFIVPKGYQLSDLPVVETDPAAEIVAKPGPPSEVSIQLARPLTTGQSTTIGFQLIKANEPQRGEVRFAVPAVMWKRAERTGSVTVNPSNAFEHSSPFVVVYQDFPPQGEQTLKLADVQTVPESTNTGPAVRPSDTPGGTMLVQPRRCQATVEPERIVIDLTGRTAAAVASQRIVLPKGMTVESVRISQYWLDRYRVVDNILEYDSGTAGNEPFEIHGTIPLSSKWVEHLHLDIADNGEMATQWSSTTGMLIGPSTTQRTVWVLHAALLTGIGWFVAGLLLLPLFRTTRETPTRWAFRAFLTVAAIAGVCAFFGGIESAVILPASVAIVGLVIWVIRTKPAAIASVVLIASFPAFAVAPPASNVPTVYIVNGTGDDASKLFALVPKELNERLERLMNPLPSETVFCRAEYRVEERADEATFEAKWTVSLSGKVPQQLAVPCSGVKVTSVQLDGQPAFPEPMPNGFAVSLPTTGLHVITAKLTVPIRRTADEREIRLTGPDVPEGSLIFLSEKGSRAVSIASRKGRQTSTDLGNGITETNAELGEGNVVVIRWRTTEVSVAGEMEDSTEVAVWDLGEGTATLNAGFLFPTNRSAPLYRIAIPAGLSVTRVSARSINSGNPVPTDWKFENANDEKSRILSVSARATGEAGVAISLILVPDRLLSQHPVLSFPRAANRPDPNAVYAIRTNGITLPEFTVTGAVDLPVESVAKAATRFPDMVLDTRPATKAFQRTNDTMALKITLAPSESHSTAQHIFTWTVGQRSDLLAESKWDAPTPAFDLWELPETLTPVSVRGTDVIDWSYANHRLGVWLRTGDESAVIRWTATMGEQTGKERTLPLPRSIKANPAPRTVRIRSGPGWNVKLIPMMGVTAVADQANTYSVEPSVTALKVTTEAVEISPPAVPPTTPSGEANITTPNTPATQTQTPVTTEEADATVTPVSLATPWRSIAGWLCLFVVVACFTKWGSGRFVPEMVVGWGVLGWLALGPLFAAIVVTGLIYRMMLILK